MRETASATDLLDWYDRHARDLPWRVGPVAYGAGERPDPYRVWLSEIMLQQTTVAAVKTYFEKFTELWPTVGALATAPDERVMGEWAGLGYYARARNLLKCARVVTSEHGGKFPEAREALLKLPGIGPYTASAISAIAYGLPETVVDGNVERVMARLFTVRTPLPKAKPELIALAEGLTPTERPGDYAQAVMDLGATICTPRSPACGICPWNGACRARSLGIQNELPAKEKKKPKPTRHGTVYIGRREDGAWLLERRPDKGLLGGMLAWPGSDWGDAPSEAPPAKGNWRDVGAEVRHTFTHFHLRLTVRTAQLDYTTVPERGEFFSADRFHPKDLPTVMRKAFDLVAASHVDS